MTTQNTSNPSETHAAQPSGRTSRIGWLLPLGFGALAVGLYMFSKPVDIPVPPMRVIDSAQLVVKPRRTAMVDPPHIKVAGLEQSCNGCHQIFHSESPSGATINYHTETSLSHGLNNRCANCHDTDNRERLTLRDGTTVPFSQTPQLCAQCHGTVYRDWEKGMHGKTLGSWMTDSAAQLRLSCNECHNPHSPKYEPYSPMPGPNTLRMGPQHATPSNIHEGKGSPLQRWLEDAKMQRHDGPTHHGGHP